jgi:hypothetical protein
MISCDMISYQIDVIEHDMTGCDTVPRGGLSYDAHPEKKNRRLAGPPVPRALTTVRNDRLAGTKDLDSFPNLTE